MVICISDFNEKKLNEVVVNNLINRNFPNSKTIWINDSMVFIGTKNPDPKKLECFKYSIYSFKYDYSIRTRIEVWQTKIKELEVYL